MKIYHLLKSNALLLEWIVIGSWFSFVAARAWLAPSPANAGSLPVVDQGSPHTPRPVALIGPAIWVGDLRRGMMDRQDESQAGLQVSLPQPLKYVPGQEPKGRVAPLLGAWLDPLAQTTLAPGYILSPMPVPLRNFTGISYASGGSGWPPDPVGDVGPSHYLQAVNTSLGIYAKDTGQELYLQTFNTFFTGPLDTPCDTHNRGDPVVVYDPIVGRWLVADFAWGLGHDNTGPFYQCLAVSQGPDPLLDGWYFYALRADTEAMLGYLNDYPKVGVWSDGWYMTANMFKLTTPTAFAVRVWALDRQALIQGAPGTAISFDLCQGASCDSLLPANLRGDLPPSGSPAYFLSALPPDTLRLWCLFVDWDTPSNSTLREPVSIQVAPFVIAPSVLQWDDPAVAVSVTQLDSLSFRLMMQLQYRNVEGQESLWATHTVAHDQGAAVRWYEIRDPSGAPQLFQQGTYAPDRHSRWMPSLAVDQDGNMAIGYSVSSDQMYPAIRYAGRLNGEVPGVLTQAETSLLEGAAAQLYYTRWGDYTSMTIDPLDDCTFWYTNEYYAAMGINWQTRIGAFKYPTCGQEKGLLTGMVLNSHTCQPVPGVLVTATSPTQTLTVQTSHPGAYALTLVSGVYTITAGPLYPGYPISQIIPGVTITAGLSATYDFSLAPAPYLEAGSLEIDDPIPLGNANGFLEPGEGAFIWPGIHNSGAITATQVRASLHSLDPLVRVTSSQVAYPDLAAGFEQESLESLDVQLDPSLYCGSTITLTQSVTDSLSVYLLDWRLVAAELLPRAAFLREEVEAGSNAWSNGGAYNLWAITSLDSHSPAHAWSDSPQGDYANNTDSYLLSPSLDLSGKRHVQLSAWVRYALELGYDYVLLEISLDDGLTWLPHPVANFNGYQPEWFQVTLDAGVLDEQPQVRFRFRLVTDAGVTADGFYLDDIELSYEPFRCNQQEQRLFLPVTLR